MALGLRQCAGCGVYQSTSGLCNACFASRLATQAHTDALDKMTAMRNDALLLVTQKSDELAEVKQQLHTLRVACENMLMYKWLSVDRLEIQSQASVTMRTVYNLIFPEANDERVHS